MPCACAVCKSDIVATFLASTSDPGFQVSFHTGTHSPGVGPAPPLRIHFSGASHTEYVLYIEALRDCWSHYTA
eukprot:4981163-Prymnesium_polylepis.1